MMMHYMFIMSLPRAHCGADADSINVCPHRVLNVCRDKQEASNRIGLRSPFVQFWSDSNLECPGYNGHSGILIMKMVLPMTSREEERIGERLARCIFVAF